MANSPAFTAPVTYNDQQIKDAIAAAKAQGYTDAQIAQGAAANFGVSPDRISSLMAPAPAGSFTTPSWVANAKQTIGTNVVPVYPMKTVHGGNQAENTDAAPIGYKYDNGKSEYVYLDLAGQPTGKVENRGTGLLGNVTDMAKTVAPLALAALGANYLPGLLNGSELAAAAGLDTAAANTLTTTLGSGGDFLGIGSSLTPAAIESGLATSGYGLNLSALNSGLFNPALVGTGAVLSTADLVSGVTGADTAAVADAAAKAKAAADAAAATDAAAKAKAAADAAAAAGTADAAAKAKIAADAAAAAKVATDAAGTGTILKTVLDTGKDVLKTVTDTGTGADLLKSVFNTGAGLLQGQSAVDAAKIQADAIKEAAKTAADAAKFKPVGVTTAFGKSNFGYDANGNLISAGYELTPELAAQRDAILKAAGTTGMDWMKNTQTAGQGLFNLGQGYIAKTPEQAAADWMAAQQKVLQPAQDTAYARMQQNLANTGRGGLSIAQGGDMGAANPEAQAYYNALAQQNNQLAASAQAEGRAATTFGQGLMSGGLDLVSQGYNPYKTQFGTAQSVEQAGQNALDISTVMAGRAATAGANAGQTLYRGGTEAANATLEANAYNPYASLLAGGAKAPTIADFLNTWINKV